MPKSDIPLARKIAVRQPEDRSIAIGRQGNLHDSGTWGHVHVSQLKSPAKHNPARGIDFEKFAADDLLAIRIETEYSTRPGIDVEGPPHPAQKLVMLAQKTEHVLWTRFDPNLFENWFVIGQLVS
jgi:hypothetical protein